MPLKSPVLKRVCGAFVFLCACSSIHAIASTLDDARAQFDAENYDEALPLLERAYQIDPEPSTRRYLALTYYYTQQFEQARPLLEQLVASRMGDVELYFALTDVLLEFQDPAALAQAERLVEIDPGPRSQLLLGRAYALVGKNRQAIAVLEEARAQSTGSLYQKISIELVQLYKSEGQMNQAMGMAKQTLEQSPDAFDAYYFNQVIGDLEREQKPIDIYLGYQLDYDSNVPLAPDDTIQGVRVSEESDWRHNLYGDLLARKPLGNGFIVFGEAHLRGGIYQDLTDFNSLEQSYVASLGWGQDRYGLRLPLEYRRADVDGDRVFDRVSVAPGAYYNASDTLFLYGFAQFENNDYDDTDIRSEDRSGNANLFGGLLRWRFAEDLGFLQATVEAGKDNADGRNWDRDKLRVYVYGNYQAMPKLNLSLAYEYLDFDYDNVHDVFLKKRRDDINSFYATAAYIFDKSWTVQLQGAYTNSDSNIKLYDYDRYVLSLGAVWRY